MLPFRAPSSGAAGMRRDASGLQDKRVPSQSAVGGRRIVSQGLARKPLRTPTEAPSSAANAPPSLQVDTTSFEEWMKMATDNKINATNTWNFALIDYFHDMSLLRSDSGDGSINFQKASCTLDGCVKVWTSRVDSVMAETGRLLSGLQDEDASAGTDPSSMDPDQSGLAEDDDDAEAGEGRNTSTRKRRGKAREATLAKSFAQLQVKRYDLEFTVDPLFKKTSADFDEGGAGGLLMNHLHIDDTMKVVFDASDVTAAVDTEKEEAAVPTTDDAPAIDLGKLQSRLLAAAAQTHPESMAESQTLEDVLASRMLCPSTSAFTFADDNEAALPTLTMSYDDMEAEMDMEMDMEEDLPDMDGLDFFDGTTEPGLAVGEQGERAFDAAVAHDNHDMASSTTGPTQAHEQLFTYFDNRMQKNWAGPEHWKMTRLHSAASAPRLSGPASDSAPATSEAKPRRGKEAMVIDFLSSEPGPSTQTLFAPSATPASICLPKAAQAVTARHLLPEDQHFNSQRLLRLFLKPKATILLQKRRREATPAPMSLWDDDGLGDVVDDRATPFRTDLFEDVNPYEDVLPPMLDTLPSGDAELGGDDDVEAEDDVLLGGEALRRVRPEFVEHARRAKQVDVKKLKDNIWKTLALSSEPQTFDTALQGLQSLYPRKQYDEISTSFCFICLLHLANEESLRIDVASASSVPHGTASPGAFLAAAARAGRVLSSTDDDDALGASPAPSAKADVDDAYADEAHVGQLGTLRIQRDMA
ncbi:brn1-protein required for chromosome condensation [Malassezia pachydermatis]|uniref:Condensin complex subunit 2 n=1 Tax=Malassezia pachydermatis TaxID=77020 RepID=A0A0M8MR51_9BASI|nr:brn1-protein required for chromosome condensation [Malassezia pachydermatis]KOS12654.1 brn1-protein required for chromosome condensation [Malassezia pachydermatis]